MMIFPVGLLCFLFLNLSHCWYCHPPASSLFPLLLSILCFLFNLFCCYLSFPNSLFSFFKFILTYPLYCFSVLPWTSYCNKQNKIWEEKMKCCISSYLLTHLVLFCTWNLSIWLELDLRNTSFHLEKRKQLSSTRDFWENIIWVYPEC